MIRSSMKHYPFRRGLGCWFYLLILMLLPIGMPGGALAADASTVTREAGEQTRRTYNFQDLEIRQALSALAQDQGINLIMSPDVTGKISVHLNQLTVEESLNAITMAGGFAYKKQEDLYYVYKPKPVPEVKPEPKPVQIEIRVFRLKFTPIDKMQEILTAIPGMRMIRLHEQTKTIVVEDTPQNIAKVEKILQVWDTAPQQVLIEARIMEINLTDDMQMGVDWTKAFGDLTVTTAGFLPPGATSLTANLATAVGTRDQFTAALKALQLKTNINTLSTPKILALHGKLARVQVGGKQGYKTSTTSLGVVTETVNFLDTGTILDITPYIDDMGNVLMDVKPQINSVSFDPITGTPFQKTTNVSTSLMAKDGQTIFIGGLIEDSKTDTRNIVPCLGDIPGLGLMFGQMGNTIKKSELVILITPQIVGLETTSATALEKAKKMEYDLKKEPQPLSDRLLNPLP